MANVTFQVRLAWWSIPLAYVVAFSLYPFVGEKRAAFLAAKAACRGLKIT